MPGEDIVFARICKLVQHVSSMWLDSSIAHVLAGIKCSVIPRGAVDVYDPTTVQKYLVKMRGALIDIPGVLHVDVGTGGLT